MTARRLNGRQRLWILVSSLISIGGGIWGSVAILSVPIPTGPGAPHPSAEQFAIGAFLLACLIGMGIYLLLVTLEWVYQGCRSKK
jgi:hypothetical protein